MTPLKKADSNKGSCGGIAAYLDKEKGKFFTNDRQDVELEEAINIIESHSKGRLGKEESKWYAPLYSLSENECQHVCKILFQKEYKDLSDLSKYEKNIFENYLIFLGRRFQDAMAKNFEKEDLGISSGADLVYVGRVEYQRKYSRQDPEVMSGAVKANTKKPGFNAHIHIIQSRKANNAKQSKISPESKNISREHDNFNNKSRQGFNRTKFFSLIEETFDNETNYDRKIAETFDYRNEFKKETLHQNNKDTQDALTSQKSDKSRKMESKRYFKQDEIEQLTKNASLVDYFYSLADRGILKYEGKSGNQHVFNNMHQKTGSIYVSDDKGKWKDFSGDGGQILKAMMKYEGMTWHQALSTLEEKQGYQNYQYKNPDLLKSRSEPLQKPSDVKIVSAGKVTSPNILNYYMSRGISKEIIDEHVKQVVYERAGRKYYAGGTDNVAGGFNIRTQNFKGVVGKMDVSTIPGNKKPGEALIFEGFMDYLSYLELNRQLHCEETVIILNSTSNINGLLAELQRQNITSVTSYVDADQAGDRLMDTLKEKYSGKIHDGRTEYDLTPKVDLNSRLIITQMAQTARTGLKM